MIYQYRCEPCTIDVDIIKPAKLWDRTETCEKCEAPMNRMICTRLYLNNTQVHDKTYSPALGRIVDSPTHERRLAKEKGLIEIGNEKIGPNIPKPGRGYNDL